MEKLHPRSAWIFAINHFFKFLLAIVFIAYLRYLLLSFQTRSEIISGQGIWFFSSTILAMLLISAILSYFLGKLSYHFYRYELTESGFKKEHGIIWKNYVTIPYNRIQNVDIFRGPLARILGLADLHIQTAGMSMAGRGGTTSEGRLPGLSMEIAEKLRNELIGRIEKPAGNQGL